jgi:tetratricopeptide (TPR) repeat protein
MFMRRSREVGDSLVQSYADLGDIFRDDSAHAKAASYYRRGLAVDPANASLRVRMGSVLLALDRRDSARSECLRALALDTGSTEAHWVLGQLAERDQDTAWALGHYHRYLQLSRSGMHARAVDDRLRLLSKP